MKHAKITKIVSGGQTGADRGALDFALENAIAITGYVPRCRMAEDGPIDDRYPNLMETDSNETSERTRLNIRLADATLIVSHGAAEGGSKYTYEYAVNRRSPVLHIDLRQTTLHDAAVKTREWLIENNVNILNVAGPRASEDPHIYLAVKALLKLVFDFK